MRRVRTGCRRRVAIFGYDDDGFRTLRDHVVNLVALQLHIMVGFLRDYLVAILLK